MIRYLMSTMQTPQDEIAAIQATLALHAEDLELIKQQLPEIAGAVRQAIEQATAEFVATHERHRAGVECCPRKTGSSGIGVSQHSP